MKLKTVAVLLFLFSLTAFDYSTAEGRSVNIRVTSLLPELKLAGRVVFSEGRPAANAAVTISFVDGVKRLTRDDEGRFSTTTISGTKTTISASASLAPERFRECPNALEISAALGGETRAFSNVKEFGSSSARDDLLLKLPVPSCRSK